MIQSVAPVSDFGKRISVKSAVEGNTRGIAVAARRIKADQLRQVGKPVILNRMW
jgi:hypothetical protein